MMKTVLLLLLLCPILGFAQGVKVTAEDLKRHQSFLLLRDGLVVRGKIIREDSLLITVRKPGGEMTYVEREQLIGILPIRPRSTQVSATSSVYTVFVLKDSVRIEGQFVKRDSTMITVRNRNGRLTYFEPELLDHVDTVRVDRRVLGDSTRQVANRFSPWVLLGQAAYNPEKGQFYYRNTWLMYNEAQYGINRFWSVGANFLVPVPYLNYDGYLTVGNYLSNNYRLQTKLSAPIGRKIQLGLNVAYQPQTNSDWNRPGIWTAQALLSLGNRQRNLTLGYGLVDWGRQRVYQYWSSYYPTPYTYERAPRQSFLTLGLTYQLRPGLTLLSDNKINLGKRYYAYGDNGERSRLSLGLRIDRRRHAFDLGVYGLLYRDNYYWNGKKIHFYPYIGYNLFFGPKFPASKQTVK
ncbi:hypothetical protein WBJ53_16070 [Spirosoma sp. SC4-14]|uniref:hypothetical protein n=1 Tax=Spirosoma sp. SC4-14 TaxID=3128900 RepID=UPI0030D4FEA4